MKSNNLFFPLLVLITTLLTSCEAVGDIFQAGIWIGVIIVVLVVGVIFWLINKAKK
jgi:predicted Abi (CAAX) family protease